jgi:hypothetical protein
MTTKSKQTLKINLDEIRNPHKAIRKLYSDAKAMDLYHTNICGGSPDESPVLSSSFMNEKRVFDTAANSEKPIKHTITAIYRKRINGKEFGFFNNQMETFDYFNNPVGSNRVCGRYQSPIILNRESRDPKSGMKQVTPEIIRMEDTFEWEWHDLVPQLQEWHDKGKFDPDIQYIVIDRQQRYSKPYSWEEISTLDFENLVLLGKYGKRLEGITDTNTAVAMIRSSLTESIKEIKQVSGPASSSKAT